MRTEALTMTLIPLLFIFILMVYPYIIYARSLQASRLKKGIRLMLQVVPLILAVALFIIVLTIILHLD